MCVSFQCLQSAGRALVTHEVSVTVEPPPQRLVQWSGANVQLCEVCANTALTHSLSFNMVAGVQRCQANMSRFEEEGRRMYTSRVGIALSH